jgi:hypothetical protein
VKTKKSTSFWVGIASLLLIYFATLAMAAEAVPAVGPAVILGIVGACGFYQGSNVADNWQRSKYYQPALDRNITEAGG